MQKEFMENLASASRDAFKPTLGIYNLTTRVCEELIRNNMGLINHIVANSMKQVQAVGAGKFENIITAHTDNSNKLVSCAQQNLEVLRQATNELTQLFDNNVKDYVKKPAQTSAKVEA